MLVEMCTIGILLRAHPEVPLVIIANRDEFYARAARPPEVLDAGTGAAGGVDAQSGGTWLGVTRRGRIVAVTNQRAAALPVQGVRSRGHAVRGALVADDLDAHVRSLDPREFSSMNLLYGDATSLHVAYFRHDTGTVDIDELPAGVHVLCNDRIEAPGFPRGQRLAGVLRATATAPWPTTRARLAAALADHTRTEVREDEPGGLTRELATALTSVCIHSPLYGTRSSAIVALAEGRVLQYLHAEGAPCTAPFVDHTGLVA
jgi:uncharacterized protein with NRDE domain